MFENYEMESRGKTMVLENTEKCKQPKTTKALWTMAYRRICNGYGREKKMKPISKIDTFPASGVISSVELNDTLTCFPFSGN